jgi:hypothetical protein
MVALSGTLIALSGTLIFVYQICAAEHDIFLFFRGAFFQNELPMSFASMPSLISSRYSV